MSLAWRKNRKYLFLILVLCGLTPHLVLAVVRGMINAERILPIRAEAWILFFLCQWTPFWALFLSHWRQQKQDDFSLVPMLAFALMLLSFLPVAERKCICVLVWSIPLLLSMECLYFLKKWENAAAGLLRGAAENRSLLRVFFFWSVAVPGMIHIACRPFGVTAVNPLILLPIPGILVFCGFRQLQEQPPALGGLLGMALLLTISLSLAASGPMASYKLFNVTIILSGYGAFLLLQLVYHMDRFHRKPKSTDAA